MAGDNITPIYGEWLYQHLGYYQFHGNEAEALRRRISAIDITKAESDRELIECYREFVTLFVNDMFQIAFAPPTEGITTRYIKAFLVNNAYNVMAPIEFLEENGMKANYNLDERANQICGVLKNESKSLSTGYESIREDVDRIVKWKRSESATIFRGLLILALCVFILWKSYLGLPMIKSDVADIILKIMWIFILPVLIVGFFKGILELSAGVRRQKFLKAAHKCSTYSICEGNNISDDSNSAMIAQINEYRNVLKDILEKGTAAELPKPSKQLGTDNKGIGKETQILTEGLINTKKMRRKAGKLILMALFVAAFYWVSGRDMVLNRSRAEVAVDTVEEENQNDAPQPQIGAVIVDSTVASSELKTAKTGFVYGSDYTIDNDKETCWQDGAGTDGTGEWISYIFPDRYYLVSVEILNGRVSSEEKYYANGRIENARIFLYLNEQCVYEQQILLEDLFDVKQSFEISVPEGVECDTAQIFVDSVYQGNTYDDLCLTEIAFNHMYYEDN